MNKITKRTQTVGDLSAVRYRCAAGIQLPVQACLTEIAVVGCFCSDRCGQAALWRYRSEPGKPCGNCQSIHVHRVRYTDDYLADCREADTRQVLLWMLRLLQLRWAYFLTEALQTCTMTDSPRLDLFLGNVGGCIGEVSALAILIGGLFLIWKKVISPIIPVTFIATVFVLGLIWGGFDGALFHILAGGVMLGAFFCATDYVTSPTLPLGKVIFGIGCGLFTMLIRIFASYPEGVSFAILLMNILTPYIDRICEKQNVQTAEKSEGGREIK